MSKGRLAANVIWQLLLMVAVMGVLLFLPAGTWRFWPGWAFLGVFFAASLGLSLYFVVYQPDLIARRMRSREPERGQQIGQGILMVLFFGGMVLSGLDHRYGWSHLPAALVLIGDAGILAGFLFIFRVFQENRFAGSTVEAEAGQPVISSGLYAVVRHPMYLGAVPLFLGMPFALASYWAIPLYLFFFPMLVLRIRTEEAVLRRDLPGYEEYTHQVRWRLIPGVW